MFLESLTGKAGNFTFFGIDVKCIPEPVTAFKLHKLVTGFLLMPPLIGRRLNTIVHEFGHAFAVKALTSFQPHIELSVSPFWQDFQGTSQVIFKPPGYNPFTERGRNFTIAASGHLAGTIHSLSSVLLAIGMRKYSPTTACLIAYSISLNMLVECCNTYRRPLPPDYWNMAMLGGRNSKENIAAAIKGLNMLGMLAVIGLVFIPGIPKIPAELRHAKAVVLDKMHRIATRIFGHKI